MSKTIESISITKRITYFLLTIILCSLISFYIYGNSLVGISSLGGTLGSIATVDCINFGKASLLSCKAVGIPNGSSFVNGSPYFYVAAGINYIINNTLISVQLATLVFLIAGFYGFVFLCSRLKINFFVANIFACLYLISPFNIAHVSSGYNVTGLSFLLIPLSILLDLYLCDLYSKKIDHYVKCVFFVTYTLFKFMLLLLDGYGFIFSLLPSFLIILIFAQKNALFINIKTFSIKKLIVLLYICQFIFSIAISVFLYKNILHISNDFIGMPADFYRSSGVDLITLVWPTDAYYLPFKLHYAFDFNPLDYWGDGSHISYNYLGLLLLAPIFFILFHKKISLKIDPFFYIIIYGFFISLFLSLGPSIKINSHKVISGASHHLEFKDYLMPKSEATLNLGTDFLYTNLPGFKNVRAVYRWNFLSRFFLLILAAFLLSELYRHKKFKFLGIFLLLLIVDSIPHSSATRTSNMFYEQYQRINSDLIDNLKIDLRPKEKVFYISSENDYLADYITMSTKTFSYNLAGDKAIGLAMHFWPKQIVDFREGIQEEKNITFLLNNNIVDVVVLPFFNLRWDSYRWPPNEKDTLENQKTFMNRYSYLLSEPYFYVCRKYYCAIRLKSGVVGQ